MAGNSERRPLMAANWKMNKTVDETERFFAEFLPGISDLGSGGSEVVVAPPYLSLARAVELTWDAPVRIAAQNAHEEDQGAFTGEVSRGMLLELAVKDVIVGHSERRSYFNETDEVVKVKAIRALDAGLRPIVCVGETEEEREAGETENRLRQQVTVGLSDIADDRLTDIVVAYEPVWAIGTGKTATPEQAQEAMSFIRSLLANRDEGAAAGTRILYGGSIKPSNVDDLMSQPDIDGGLVGGASLEPDSFLALVNATR